MKKTKIIYWVTTSIIFLWEGLMTAMTFNAQIAKDGFQHLGYPEYFRVMLSLFCIIGSIVLIVPAIPGRLKEWAYVGFGINFISAAVSLWAVDGFGAQILFPLVLLGILAVSYVQYHKLPNGKEPSSALSS